jgi:type II secretion system protein I
MTAGATCGMHGAGQCGFTLIEVMVALVIVAFGMGAVLAALSSAAGNIAALHDKTLAQWIALNQVADTRLNLQVPGTGTTEGDVKAFGNANWHWRQDIVPVPSIPGLLEIVVRVQRTGASSGSSSSGSSSSSSGSSLFKSSSGFGSSSGSGPLGFTTSSSGSSFGFSSSSGSTLGLSSSSGTLGTVSSITAVTNSGKDQNWLVTVIGFRGDAVAASSGEAPDWNGIGGTASSASSSGASGASSSGAMLNPGTSPGSAFSSSSGAGIGSSGGN